MKNLSLYRKYRPQNFDNLVGQEHVRTTLINALKSETTAHAYLFAGPRGTGKTSTARLIAKSLNCTSKKDGFEPCDECEFCKDINEGRLIDLIEIDAASNRGIDEIRALKEKIGFSPTRAKKKVYIIDEVHMLTKEAFNALLKTLEEPPEHAVFVLATTEVHKIPDTIISRCQRFDFRRIAPDNLKARLKTIAEAEKIEVEEEALDLVTKHAEGGMRDGISLFEQLVVDGKLQKEQVLNILGLSDMGLIEGLFKSLLKNESTEALGLVDQVYKKGTDMQRFAQEFIEFLRGKMLAAVDKRDLGSAKKVLKLIDLFQDAARFPDASIPQLPLEMAIVKIGLLFEKKTEPAATAPAPAAPQSVAQATQAAAPTPSPATSPVAGGNSSAEQAWQQLVARVKQPALARSLKNAKIESASDSELVLQFGSNFHMDQAINAESKSMIEKMLKELTSKDLKVSAKVVAEQPREHKPIEAAAPAAVASPPPAPQPVAANDKKDSQVSDALDVFGGEVV